MARNGFTLVELMVAIAVLALLTSAAVLTASLGDRQPREAANRLASRLAAARDEAVLTGRPMGVWVSASGYGFEQRRDGRWQAIDEKPFDGGDWGDGISLSGQNQQRLRFDALGLPDRPARLTLLNDGRSATIAVAAGGEVSVQ